MQIKLCFVTLKVLLRRIQSQRAIFQEERKDTLKRFIRTTKKKRSDVGIAGLMSDKKFNLVPDDLQRMNRRKDYEDNDTHASLKDKRDKRDQLKR